ncbi:MAG TPA: rod shape-determining protein MreC, partial [Terriglobales bacterium]|nr:rod shape-determining protein MreC [Terriglobales bacterium]
DGVVGKILRVFPTSSQVLLINDPSSGVGAILEKSRLQGVIKGTANGELLLEKMMSDERVEAGDQLLTSGGDQIFPKGLPIGVVKKVSPGKDVFLNVQVKPAAELSRLEEVLVITQVVQRQPSAKEAQASMRAVDILASRLPSIPDNPRLPSTGVPLPVGVSPPAAKPAGAKTAPGAKSGAQGTPAQAGSAAKPHAKSGQTAEAQLTNGAVKVSVSKPKAEAGSGSATAPRTSAPSRSPAGMAQNPPPATPPTEPQP